MRESVFTDFLLIASCCCVSVFTSDYESLRKEDVFENNRLVRSQVAELLIPVEVTLRSSCGKQTQKKNTLEVMFFQRVCSVTRLFVHF